MLVERSSPRTHRPIRRIKRGTVRPNGADGALGRATTMITGLRGTSIWSENLNNLLAFYRDVLDSR